MSARARRSAATTGTPTSAIVSIKNLPVEMVNLEDITDETATQMATDAIDWALCNGLGMRPADNTADNAGVVEIVPFTLLPGKFDVDIFNEANAIQKDLNVLYMNCANDFDFLKTSLKDVIQGDEFTRKLFEILEKVHKEGVAQPVALNIMRADYMLHKVSAVEQPEEKTPVENSSATPLKQPRSKKAKTEKYQDTFLKQVEVNTIAASFGGLSPKVQSLHKFVLQTLMGVPEVQFRHSLPENNSVQLIADGIVQSWREYQDAQAVVLFVVEKETRNICDQRLLEYEVFNQSAGMIKTVRMTLEQIATECHWDESAKILTVPEKDCGDTKENGEKEEPDGKADMPAIVEKDQSKLPETSIEKVTEESKKAEESEKMQVDADQAKPEKKIPVAVDGDVPEVKTADKIRFSRPVGLVYFRAGYMPEHYPTEMEWLARERIERSRAIKCPSIGFHLAGTKKVQQILTDPGAVTQFVKGGKRVADRLCSVFTEMYGFDDEKKSDAAMAAVKANPGGFVLKPQREGGGNNIYGEEVLKTLEGMTAEERAAHVLMSRITPPQGRNCIVRRGEPVNFVDTLNELGIFGFTIATKHSIKANEAGGYIFRTKQANTDEGGIMAGASGLSTPFLTK